MICHRCCLPAPDTRPVAEIELGPTRLLVCEDCLHAMAERGEIPPTTPITVHAPARRRRGVAPQLRCQRDGRPIDDPAQAARVHPSRPSPGARPVILCRPCLTQLVLRGLVAWERHGWTFQRDPRFGERREPLPASLEWPGDSAFWTRDRVWELARLDADASLDGQ
jgi:hypothetical protein